MKKETTVRLIIAVVIMVILLVALMLQKKQQHDADEYTFKTPPPSAGSHPDVPNPHKKTMGPMSPG